MANGTIRFDPETGILYSSDTRVRGFVMYPPAPEQEQETAPVCEPAQEQETAPVCELNKFQQLCIRAGEGDTNAIDEIRDEVLAYLSDIDRTDYIDDWDQHLAYDFNRDDNSPVWESDVDGDTNQGDMDSVWDEAIDILRDRMVAYAVGDDDEDCGTRILYKSAKDIWDIEIDGQTSIEIRLIDEVREAMNVLINY